ncbi:MAG: phospholipase A [Opitutaceae bacterium]|nr:phospholipase A [Opitutaceae bacterium]
MQKFAMAVCLLFTSVLAGGQDVVVSLLVPTEAVTPGFPVSLNLVLLNPAGTEARVEMPDILPGRLQSGAGEWPVELRAQAGATTVIAPGAFAYRTYVLRVPGDAGGRMVLEITKPALARAVLVVGMPPGAATAAATVPGRPAEPVPAPLGVVGSQPAAAQIQQAFTGHFSTHLPIYFIFGPDKPAAKFQFSFKYRLWGDDSAPGTQYPSLHGVYFGYTQRSVWDITSYSSPFYDTSYMPELIFQSLVPMQGTGRVAGLQWLGYQAAAQHESNGQGVVASRSMNLVYVRPMLAFGRRDGWWLVFAPKLFAYVGGLSDNPDLARYRGYGEYALLLTKNNNLSLTLTGRIGSHWDKGSLQVDLTYPLRARFGDFATFMLVQYFDGYGESLLDYQKRSSTVRAGFSFVR